MHHLLWVVPLTVLWLTGAAVVLVLMVREKPWRDDFPWKTFWNSKVGICLAVTLQMAIWPLLLSLAFVLWVAPKLRRRFS